MNAPLLETPELIAADVAAVARIGSVPSLLQVICSITGMGFAAVARVSDSTWTACAVRDEIQFGLKPGGQLDLRSTLCFESRQALEPIIIDHASQDPRYCDHHTPRQYNIESYISVPIVLANGHYFGNLCAIDPRPARLKTTSSRELFVAFAELIALHLDNERRREDAESALLNEKAASDLREQFIAVLGHDLRNPLAALSASSAAIELSTKETMTRDLVQRMGASVKRMSHLINDVMDLARSRLGSGLALTERHVTDLGRLLENVIEELAITRPQNKMLSEIAIDDAVYCDPERIQQLLSNLVANALTHGSDAQPVRIKVFATGQDLIIEVHNVGEPISQHDLANVFQPYWRSSSSKAGGGLGLGLYICSEIVKAHRGKLSVTSSALSGTSFRAMLPAGAPEEA